jgi:hypothetical protein
MVFFSSPCLQLMLDIATQPAAVSGCGKTAFAICLAIHQIFGEIPLAAIQPQPAWLWATQILKQGIGIQANNFSLGKQREGNVEVVQAKLPDTPVLEIRLKNRVTGESQHRKILVTVGAVEIFQATIPERKATMAGGIDDQQYLATVRFQ